MLLYFVSLSVSCLTCDWRCCHTCRWFMCRCWVADMYSPCSGRASGQDSSGWYTRTTCDCQIWGDI